MKGKILAYGNYYKEFIATLNSKETLKLKYVLSLMETEDRMPVKFIKAIRDGLYELRVSKEDTKDSTSRNRKGIKNKSRIL